MENSCPQKGKFYLAILVSVIQLVMHIVYLIVDNSRKLWKTSLDFSQSLFRLIFTIPPAVFFKRFSVQLAGLADKNRIRFFCKFQN